MARNQNINNLLICKYRMIMPTQTKGNFKLFIVFLSSQKVWFYWFSVLSVRVHQPASLYVCCLICSRALFCFRLLEKNKYLFNMFRTRDNREQRASDWVHEWVSKWVCVSIVYSTRLRSMTSIWMHNWVRAHVSHNFFFFPPNINNNNFSFQNFWIISVVISKYGCPMRLSHFFSHS